MFKRITKDFKTTVLGIILIGLAVFVTVQQPINELTIDIITFLLVGGIGLLFAPDRMIDLMEKKVFGKTLLKKEKDDEP